MAISVGRNNCSSYRTWGFGPEQMTEAIVHLVPWMIYLLVLFGLQKGLKDVNNHSIDLYLIPAVYQ